MKLCFVVVLLVCPLFAADGAKLERELDEIGRVASVMLDGDVCQRILTARALQYIFQKNSRDPYADSDNYDVDDQSFILIKKTLMRLANLTEVPVDVNLWMPLPSNPVRIHIAIRNRHEMSQFWQWGELHQPMFPVMKTVLDTGRRMTVRDKPGYISVLAPVKNSLGDVVGLVEVVSRLEPDPRENVK